jgi:O-antigen/teichoic acid export membrane protein
MKVYFREIAWVAIAQGAAFVGGLATVKVAAVGLGPSEYGKLSVGLAIIGIFQVCLYGAISQTATRFLAYAGGHGLLREYNFALAKLAALSAIVIGSAWAAAVVFGMGKWLPLPAAILALYAIINGVQAIMLAVFNAARRRELVAVVQIAEAVVRPLFILALTRVTIPTAYHAMAGYVSTSVFLVVLIVAIFYLGDSAPLKYDPPDDSAGLPVTGRRLSWDMTTFAAPFVIFGLLGALGSHGERLLLARWASWSDVGSYALMAQLVGAPNVVFTTIINQFYFPLVFQSDPSGTRRIVRSFRIYLLISILGIVAITALVALLGPFLIALFSTKDFLGHEHLLWFLGMSAGLFWIAQQLVLPGLRLNRPAVYMPAKLTHSMVLLASSLLLVPRWGIDGMGASSLLSSMAYLSATMLANVWLKRTQNPRLEKYKP